jgi:Fe-coproporphyrin III synthase
MRLRGIVSLGRFANSAAALLTRAHTQEYRDLRRTRWAPSTDCGDSVPDNQDSSDPHRRMRPTLAAPRYGLNYLVGRHLLHRNKPLIRGLVLTNRCNLRCRHCDVAARGLEELGFAEATAAVDAFYREGGRCLYLEGGEPFLWEDGPHRLDDIVDYAHGLGYLTVIVYTNGTLPLRSSADTIFVSVDGLRTTHDSLRGTSFDRIVGNIRDSPHRSLFINYTVNAHNKDEIRAFCREVGGVANIRGIFFYLHTPYYGHDTLELGSDERTHVLNELLSLRRSYRILNSRAGLQSALRNDWARPLDTCSVYEGGSVYRCCRYSGHPELCRQCGYLSYAEIDQVLRLKPSAVANALKYF